MDLKFEIDAIKRSLRSTSEMKGIFEGGSIFCDEFVEALDAQVTVTGLPSPCLGGSSIIKLHYVERYNPESTIADFYIRAENFAKEYCFALGIDEKATPEKAANYSANMNIGVS